VRARTTAIRTFLSGVAINKMHEDPVALELLTLSNYSSRQLKVALTFMSSEEFRIP
jgi:hypothetical protein